MGFRIFARRGDQPPAVTRVEPPVSADGKRGFNAARPDRLAGRFNPLRMASPRQEMRRDLRGLIEHSREAARNIDYIHNFESMVRRHVIGRGGIALQMDCRDPNDKPDRQANAKIESGWWKWGRRGNCTVCGRLSWWQVENIAATALAREGNFFARIWTGKDFGPFGFQLEILSIDLLDMDMVQPLRDGRFIEGGIEFDARGRVLAYHFFTGHPGEYHTGQSVRRVRIPAAEIIHVWRPFEAMQALGLPETHTALRRFNMLSGLEEAALTAARYGAANMAFFKRPEDDVADYSGGSLAPPIDEIEAGTIGVLPGGWDLANYSPNYPDGEFPAFAKALMKGGAVGLGVSYSALAGDLEGANFSSLRDGRGEERDGWRMFQRDLYEMLHDEVFRRWLPLAILAGQIGLPFAKIDKFDAANWRPRGWPAVNPKDDSAANASDLGNMLKPPSEIVAERGGDWDETVARFKADFEKLREAGLPLPRDLSAAVKAAQEAPPDDTGGGAETTGQPEAAGD